MFRARTRMTHERDSRAHGPPSTGPDSGQASLLILGERANLLIVREAFRWTRRYQDFKERLGMSDAVLASRLHDLVDLGVLRTEQYSERPPRFEYRLTECGIDFWKTAIGVWEWERRWSHRINGRLPEFVHLVGGHQATIDFGCGGCSTSAERLRLDADSHRQLRMGQPVVPRRRRHDRGHHARGVPRRTHPAWFAANSAKNSSGQR